MTIAIEYIKCVSTICTFKQRSLFYDVDPCCMNTLYHLIILHCMEI